MMVCDKCGKPVVPENDATRLDRIMFGVESWHVMFTAPRHLLPTEDCEGSPSRAQYLEGQPRDTRGYSYIEEREHMWRDAYTEMLEKPTIVKEVI